VVRWAKDRPALVEPAGWVLGTHPMSDDGKVLVGGTEGKDREGIRVGPAAKTYGADTDINGVSDDGKITVGRIGREAAFWKGSTPTRLGRLPGYSDCYALAVSSDGGRIAGNCVNTGMQERHLAGFIWDKKGGMRSIADALAKAGVAMPDGELRLEVTDICGYGLTLVGHATRAEGGGDGEQATEAWLAILPR
jgi:hypothetical protein